MLVRFYFLTRNDTCEIFSLPLLPSLFLAFPSPSIPLSLFLGPYGFMRKTRNFRRMSAASHFIKRRKSQQSMLGPSKCLPELLPDCHTWKIYKRFLVDVLELGNILFLKIGWMFSHIFSLTAFSSVCSRAEQGMLLVYMQDHKLSKIDRRHWSALDIMVGVDRRGQHFPTSENCDWRKVNHASNLST